MIAKTLLDVETLDATQIRSLFDKERLPTDEELEELARKNNAKIKNNTSSGKDHFSDDNDVRVNIQSKEAEEAKESESTKDTSSTEEVDDKDQTSDSDSEDRRS